MKFWKRPASVGIDLSDSNIRWVTIAGEKNHQHLRAWGNEVLPEGVVQEGAIRDQATFATILRPLAERWGNLDAHMALPQRAAYCFEREVPLGMPREEVMRVIAFDLDRRGIPLEESLYDYEPIAPIGEAMEIGVVVFPRPLVEGYVEALEASGVTLASLEPAAHSAARAVFGNAEPITLLIDIRRAHVDATFFKRGVPTFTAMLELGAAHTNAVEALGEEVARHVHFWNARRGAQGEPLPSVGGIVLVGDTRGLTGLAEHISRRAQVSLEEGMPWQHVCSFDEHIPPIGRIESLRYATPIGLTLRSFGRAPAAPNFLAHLR